MNHTKLMLALFLLSLTASPFAARAQDATAPSTTTTTTSTTSTSATTDLDAEDKPVSAEEQAKWASQVKTKYNLTDAQMKTMTDAGLQGPALAKTAALAEASKQPIDKIVQMRTTDKMGWGKIAKTLGVPPSTIGQAVAGLHRQNDTTKNAEKKAEKEQRKADKKAEREERKAARKAERELRKSEKSNGKGNSN